MPTPSCGQTVLSVLGCPVELKYNLVIQPLALLCPPPPPPPPGRFMHIDNLKRLNAHLLNLKGSPSSRVYPISPSPPLPIRTQLGLFNHAWAVKYRLLLPFLFRLGFWCRDLAAVHPIPSLLPQSPAMSIWVFILGILRSWASSCRHFSNQLERVCAVADFVPI